MTTPNAWILSSEARQQLVAGDFVTSINTYTEALAAAAFGSQRQDCHFGRGQAYRAQGNPQAALEDYEQALTADHAVPSVKIRIRFYMGSAKAALDNFDGAAVDYAEVMNTCLKPNAANDYEFVISLESLPLALTDVDRLIAHKPDVAAFFCRGLAKRNLKDWAGALADYQSAIALDPQNARLREWLFAQEILQNGTPTHFDSYRPHLRADLEYQSLYKQYDMQRVLAIYFDGTTTTETPYSPAEDAQLREQLQRDGWILLKSGGNKEGDDSHYARLRP